MTFKYESENERFGVSMNAFWSYRGVLTGDDGKEHLSSEEKSHELGFDLGMNDRMNHNWRVTYSGI